VPVAVEAWRHRRLTDKPPAEQSPLGITDDGSRSRLR